jgi:hypothetical protein
VRWCGAFLVFLNKKFERVPGVLDQSLNVILDGAPGKVQTHPIESGDDVFHFYSCQLFAHGTGKQIISRMLIFGRFLWFMEGENVLSPTGDKPSNPPLGLTERHFRGFWLRTETGSGSSGGNERIRFRDVLRLAHGAQFPGIILWAASFA